MVNAAIEVAAQPWPSQVRIIDTVPVFTPGERYSDSIEVDGSETIVRESDGIHLNEAGSAIAADFGDSAARSGFRALIRTANYVFSANVCLNCFDPFTHFALALNCCGDESRIFSSQL